MYIFLFLYILDRLTLNWCVFFFIVVCVYPVTMSLKFWDRNKEFLDDELVELHGTSSEWNTRATKKEWNFESFFYAVGTPKFGNLISMGFLKMKSYCWKSLEQAITLTQHLPSNTWIDHAYSREQKRQN